MDMQRDAFWWWLRAQGDEAVVGRSCDGVLCPLATWLSETLGGVWEVSGVQVANVHTEQWGNLPAWAQAFVKRLDGACGGHEGAVLAWQALAVLEQCH